jgi:RNA polymerase sigma-70 factor (ECF subfamily)
MRSEEHELITGLLAGDQNPFKQLFNQYWDAIFNTAYRITGNRKDAEDIAQEIFFDLWTKRESLNVVRTSLAGWLASKASTTTLMFLRSRARKDLKLEEYFRRDTTRQLPDSSELKLLQIEAAVNTLPDRQREVYSMAKIQGKSHAEIAQRLDLSINYVKVTVARANEKVVNMVKRASSILMLLVTSTELLSILL